MSKGRQTFVEQALIGLAMYDEVDDFVDAWHESDSRETLANYLGFTAEEYALWVSAPDSVGLIISARQESRPITQAVNDNFEELKIAARSDETKKISVLKSWLKELGKIN